MCARINYTSLLKLMVIFNFFFPTFNNYFEATGDTGVVIINLIMFTLTFLFVGALYYQGGVIIGTSAKMFLLVSFLFLASTILGNLSNRNLIFSDLFELFRPAFYTMSFLLFYLLVTKEIVEPEEVVIFLSKVILCTAIFSLACLIFYQYGGRWMMSFYAKPSLLSARRFTGTFQNPYDFAFIAVLPLVYLTTSFVRDGGFSKLIGITILLITILFGQSKSGFASFSLGVTCSLLLCVFVVKRSQLKFDLAFYRRLLFFPTMIIFFASVVFLFYFDSFSYLFNGLERLFSGSGDTSSRIRLEQAQLAISMLDSSYFNLFFGFGSYKYSALKFESLYPLYFFRYGLFAIPILLCWVLVPIVMLVYRFSESNRFLCLILLVFFISVVPSGFGNNVIDQSRIPFVFFGCVGIVFAMFDARSSKRDLL
ncbi:hypothetical protein [Shewanella subflava]|uniref:O-antigen polymerase n=1 Tax=Shewanella subflava TaxID=2986476 RepID=A0ABT3IBR3_9GAMM|nr:hypothetical protein [Shewanella subflava]MCW3173487.1 hypothetical protein [Shewanella subflava]